MRFQCSYCQGIVAIDDNDAGQAVACGHCGAVVAVPQTRLSSGAVIDDFVIQKELGQGGMGRVFLAHQVSLDRPAALKVLHSEFSQDQEFITDFIKEARAAARLNHPGIVQAYAVGEDEGIYFFAMEFVEGSTLKQLLSHSGRIVVDRALEITGRIAEALESAWNNEQLVHRDIKPDNIILTAKGEIKLADLGLARKASDILTEGETDILGTPQYISPEQLMGEPVDNRSDIYSLGATLYHALTGGFPFTGEHPAEIARKHLAEALVPACKRIKDIPKEVSEIASIMMSKKAEDRYQNAGELAADIQRLRSGKGLTRKLQPGSQKPFGMFADDSADTADMDEDDESAAHDETPKTGARRTLSLNKNKRGGEGGKTIMRKGGAAATGSVRSAKTGKVDPERIRELGTVSTTTTKGLRKARASSYSLEDEELPKKSNALKIIGIIILVAGLTGAGIWLVNSSKRDSSGRGTGVIEGVRVPQEQQAAFQRIKELIDSGATYQQVLPEIVSFRSRFSERNRLHELLQEMAAPFTEAEIREQRARLQQEDQEEFNARAVTLRKDEAERLAAERLRKQKQEEEERRQAQLRLLEEQKRLRLENLARQAEDVRTQSIELCKELSFSRSEPLFMALAGNSEAKLAEWAKGMQDVIAQAQQAIDLLRNSGNAAEGRDIIVPDKYITDEIRERKASAKVIRFNRTRTVTVTFRAFVLDEYNMKKRDPDGNHLEDELLTVDIPFQELGPAQLWSWIELMSRRKVEPEKIALQFFCYLISIGDRRNAEAFWRGKILPEVAAKYLKLMEPIQID